MTQTLDFHMALLILATDTFYFRNMPSIQSFLEVMKLQLFWSFLALNTPCHASQNGLSCDYQMVKSLAQPGERSFAFQNSFVSHTMSRYVHLLTELYCCTNKYFVVFFRGTTQCREVQYFTRLAIGDDEHAKFVNVAVVQMYSTPDAELLWLSHQVVLASQLTDTISIICIKLIVGVIAMIPH